MNCPYYDSPVDCSNVHGVAKARAGAAEAKLAKVEAREKALEKALETLSWHVAAQSSVEGAQPMTNEMAGALARASAALAAGKP